ncbi:folylpolyglutamate synthase [Coleophoma crateriformis]|uniref:Folylpolyglutamate synthase n=1 Tax=Coleophoma crateriformis TaxID=565419 RepID=A0A3D8RPQ7_9HELO|nr:folylpolyglutamate synthase [Coleophoma crateriformis]
MWKFGEGSSLPCRRQGATITEWMQDAIEALNSLQTPYEILEARRKAGIRLDKNVNVQMKDCLARIGYSQRDLDKLNIVHVAGTKGKGSTSAFVDSILSQYRKSHDQPQNIGLYTSPHLIAVRERFRINSQPITPAKFARYFFDVWDALESSAKGADVPLEKPVYFRYLTLMSYHVFLSEGVNAAVYETGVGGEYDATNIVERPAVTGISTLGIDHVFTLGNTIEEIAWHKAGILKAGTPAFSVHQVPGALEVVKQRAAETGVKSLSIVGIDKRLGNVKIRPDAEFQKGNASLAIQLAGTVLKAIDPEFDLPADHLPKSFVDGLEQVVWRGRCELKVEGNIRWYFDGAHTNDSIQVAAKWFGDESSERPTHGPRVLIFNQQGEHEALQILEVLYNTIARYGAVQFDHVIFCTNTGSVVKKDNVNHTHDSTSIENLSLQKSFAEAWKKMDESPLTTIKVLASIEEAIEYVRGLETSSNKTRDGKNIEIHTLVTGSLHLVGRALGVLEGPAAL